jgi:exopolysaccharide biosynthesis polyprenyl glycosylphosphotransferase
MSPESTAAAPTMVGSQDIASTSRARLGGTAGQASHMLDITSIRSVTTAPASEAEVDTTTTSGHRRLDGVMRIVASRLKATLVVADLLACAGALLIATWIDRLYFGATPTSSIVMAFIGLPVWSLLFAQQGLYQSRRIGRRMEEFRLVVNASLAGVIVLAFMSVAFQEPMSRAWLGLVFVLVISLVALEREVLRRSIGGLRRRGMLIRRVLIVGENAEAQELAEMVRACPELGYEVVGFVAEGPGGPLLDLNSERNLGPYLGSADHVLDMVHETDANGVVVATTGIDKDSANRLVRQLTRSGLYVEMTSAVRDISTSRMTVRNLGRYPMVCVEPVAGVSWRTFAKRAFDLMVASVALLVVSPVLILAALAIRVTSGRGVLFRQERVGRDGVLFTVFKLRTMVTDAEARLDELRAHNEAAGPMFKMKDDPRVTPVGRFLRKTSIDELPQLFNVIRGDMSLVGPRPALPSEAAQWDETLRERLRVQPGITGMWQVSGRFTASLETYARLDLYYVDNWSMVTDVAIILKTIPAVLRRHGAV